MQVGRALSCLHDPTPPRAIEHRFSPDADESCFGIPKIDPPIACCSLALGQIPNPTCPSAGENVSSVGAGEVCFDIPAREDFASMETIQRSSASCSQYSKRSTSESVPEILVKARRQGQLRMRRLRGPTLLLGTSCVLGGVFVVGPKPTLVLETLGWFLVYLGMVMLLMSLVPNDVRCVPLTSALLCIPFTFVMTLQRAWWCALYIKMLQARSCHFLEEAGHDVLCSAVALESIVCLFNSLLMFSICCYLVRCNCKRLNSPVFLNRLWKLLSFGLFCGGLLALGRIVVRFYAGSTKEGIKYIANCILAFFFFAVTARDRSIAQIQSCLLSRGESATTAAGVAELLGGKTPEVVLAHARQSFFCVPANQLTYEDLLDNRPNPLLVKQASKARLGQVDAFLSHSWHDDPTLKWAALQSWRDEFKQTHAGREPTLWIDKYCIDQNNIEESLACLPIYLAGCKKLLMLCGHTFLMRLWCLIEIFVFLEMGGKLQHLEVCFLECRKTEEPLPVPRAEEQPSGTFKRMYGSTRSHLSRSRSQISSTGSQSSGTFRWMFGRGLQQPKSFAPVETLGSLLERFNSRNARCFTEEDTLRLRRVLELTGFRKVNRLVHEVFVTKLAESRSTRS